jgi:hypothetical protein
MRLRDIVLILFAVFFLSVLAYGQAPPPPPAAAPAAAPAPAAPADSMTEENMILEGESLYHHTGERDPFSPLIRSKAAGGGAPVKIIRKSKGIGRFTVDECNLEGIVKMSDGEAAWFQGADQKPYKVQTGDMFADGVVLDVSYERGEVIVQQEIDDPTAIKPFRNVSLRIRSQSQEGEAQ